MGRCPVEELCEDEYVGIEAWIVAGRCACTILVLMRLSSQLSLLISALEVNGRLKGREAIGKFLELGRKGCYADRGFIGF